MPQLLPHTLYILVGYAAVVIYLLVIGQVGWCCPIQCYLVVDDVMEYYPVFIDALYYPTCLTCYILFVDIYHTHIEEDGGVL